MSFRKFLTALCFAPLAACAPDSSVESTEADASESEGVAGDTVYVVTRQDFRKCAYPMCGGVYVKAVNKAKTKCFDGTKQEECYVAEIDESALGLVGNQAGEIAGEIIQGTVLMSAEFAPVEGFEEFPKLVVHKAYDAETDADPTGTFYLVEPSGITCVKAPCPSLHARKINGTSVKQVTDVDLSALGLSEERQNEILADIWETHIIVSGHVKNVSTVQGTEKRLTVSQVYDTVEAETQLCLSHDACGVGSHCDFSQCLSGCKVGQICPAVCYGACVPGDAPVCPGGGEICDALCNGGDIDIPQGCPIPACSCPMPQPGSCFQACGGAAPDKTCYCDDLCAEYGDCCADYAAQCQ